MTAIVYVIPCGAEKLDRPAPAAELYTGAMFKHTLANVRLLAQKDTADGHDVQIMILSAKYGLVPLDRVLAPYDMRMGEQDPAEVLPMLTAQVAGQFEPFAQVYCFLPADYYRMFSAACQEVYVYPQDVYEGCGGIGEQRHVNAVVGRNEWQAGDDDGPGPMVWIGADVPALAWGVPLLLSYGRLRRAVRLPHASAPYVVDSRGFSEINEHGKWTITVEQYAADLIRYSREIGRPRWVAPQDWPAGAAALARTGLTEVEHQRLTIVGYEALVRLLEGAGIHVIPVVTGTTLAGYLRHLAMWEAAGYDLTVMDTVVGVGALVGRPPAEAAEIIRVLYAAGLRRMHGFGVKGPVLAEVGQLVESVDSADWSGEARRGDHGVPKLCPHGLVKHETNCRMAAQAWAVRQRAAAARAYVQEALPLGMV